MTDNKHLTIVNNKLNQKHKSKTRAKSYQDYHAKTRINKIAFDRLKEALFGSSIINENGEVILNWTEELIEELLSNIEDPGPIRNKRKKR